MLVTTRAAPTPPDERGKPAAYHTQYFPGGDRLSMAQSILVGPGEHYPGLFFQMLPYPTTQVSGIVIGPDGRPASNQLMRLLYADDDDIASGSEAAITLSAMDGTFTFLNVAAGRYTLDARGRRVQAAADGGVPLLVAGDLVMWGKTALAVGEEPIADLELRVDVAPTVYGHVVFDGLAPPARDERAALRLAVESINGVRTLQSILDDGGGFKLEGLVPGEYRLRLTLPPGWQQKSVTVGGRDQTDAPLRIEAGEIPGDVVITLTDHPTRIAGYVRDSRYFVVPGAAVIVQPIVRGTDTAAAAEARRARLVRADANGLYIIDSLAPGEYSLSAIDEAKAEGWQDPKRLQALRNAGLRITVKEGDYQLVDLRLR
jgi:hypothetical protein